MVNLKTDVNLLTWSCKIIFWRPCKVIQFSWCTILPESCYDLALFLSRFCKVHVPKILSRSCQDFKLNFWKKLILDATKILSRSWLCMVKILHTSICSRCMQNRIFSMFVVISTRSRFAKILPSVWDPADILLLSIAKILQTSIFKEPSRSCHDLAKISHPTFENKWCRILAKSY